MNAKFYVPFETAKMLKANGYPREQILTAFSQAIYDVGLADSNTAFRLDIRFQKHLDEAERDKQLTLEL